MKQLVDALSHQPNSETIIKGRPPQIYVRGIHDNTGKLNRTSKLAHLNYLYPHIWAVTPVRPDPWKLCVLEPNCQIVNYPENRPTLLFAPNVLELAVMSRLDVLSAKG